MTDQFPVENTDQDNTCAGFSAEGCLPRSARALVGEALWYASRLIHDGWVIRRIGASSEGGFFVAETPRGRVVSVRGEHGENPDVTVRFANIITALADAAQADGCDYIRDLIALLIAHAALRRSAPLKWCTWDIPGVEGSDQPVAKIRAAYWFAATLTDEYGWQLFELGAPTAGGGFIANIPGETMAIFPARMADDRTPASALARLLGQLSAIEVRMLASVIK